MHEAILRSNNGRQTLRLVFLRALRGEPPARLCDLYFGSEDYDGDHDRDHAVALHALTLGSDTLRQLREDLLEHVDLPLERMARARLIGRFDLATRLHEQIEFIFGPREGIADSPMPVFTLRLAVGVIELETHFVTDQSCLRQFAEELGVALAARSGV